MAAAAAAAALRRELGAGENGMKVTLQVRAALGKKRPLLKTVTWLPPVESAVEGCTWLTSRGAW